MLGTTCPPDYTHHDCPYANRFICGPKHALVKNIVYWVLFGFVLTTLAWQATLAWNKSRDAAMQRLRASLLIAVLPEIVVVSDSDGHIVAFNHAAEVFFGANWRSMLGEPVSALAAEPYHQNVFSDVVNELRKREGNWRVDRTVHGLAKTTRGAIPVVVNLRAIKYNNTVEYIAVVRPQNAEEMASEKRELAPLPVDVPKIVPKPTENSRDSARS